VQNAVVLLDRDEQMLSRLAELDLSAAEKTHAKLMSAEDTAEIAELGRTYQRLARSLRQTLALKARLTRERAAAERKRKPGDDPRVAARKAEVREALARFVWNEHEREDAESILDEAEWHIRIDAYQDRFLTDPIPTLVARLCRDLEIPLPSPEPGEGSDASDPGEPPDRQSSA
jgi:hypothetical protein